jgi:hypothetical protein
MYSNKLISSVKKIILRIIPIFFLTLELIGIGKVLRRLFNQIFIKPRSKLKVTDVQKLSRHIPLPLYFFITPEINKSNDWYGNATVFKKYAGFDQDYVIKAVVEHSLSFSKIIFDQDLLCPYPSMITYRKERASEIEHISGKKTYSVGPYIHYASDFLSKSENIKEKKRLGKNLLVFPVHSSVGLKNDYNLRYFCDEIAKIAKNFDTVRVCLYWRDMLYGVDEIYRSYGYECVTAGDIFDPLFLPRLKSIINNATITMSNSVGTHLGYCILLNKPHFLIKQNIKILGDKDTISEMESKADQQSFYAIEKAFGKYTEVITKAQRKLIASKWGFDQIKTPKELKEILKECEYLYNR